MPETPKYAWDYECHFESGDPCYFTITDADLFAEGTSEIAVELRDKDGNYEGRYVIDKSRLNWRKLTRRALEVPK